MRSLIHNDTFTENIVFMFFSLGVAVTKDGGMLAGNLTDKEQAMKVIHIFGVVLLCLMQNACGPIYGQALRLTEGVKNYEVTVGDVHELNQGGNLLVVGPFLGAGEEHHMCVPRENCVFPYNAEISFVSKYNDAQRFADGFKKAGLFDTQLYLEVYYDDLPGTVDRMKTLTPDQIKAAFKLSEVPDLILFGSVMKRRHKIAPLRGMEVNVRYLLDFYNPSSQKSVQIDVEVFELFKNDLKTIISETRKRLES
ncbi:MAG: hypothetical protein KJ950_11545 [Proteobacteria bacterium]|nr:hypothetical protein [Pseudomonadota bacterium]MBU1687974.1 hypothetical protein [Pseudomonadota bacterium]